MKYTNDAPTKEGFYWFTDGCEHTPTILKVDLSGRGDTLCASNEEFYFIVEKTNKKDFWCYIPEPKFPKELGRT